MKVMSLTVLGLMSLSLNAFATQNEWKQMADFKEIEKLKRMSVMLNPGLNILADQSKVLVITETDKAIDPNDKITDLTKISFVDRAIKKHASENSPAETLYLGCVNRSCTEQRAVLRQESKWRWYGNSFLLEVANVKDLKAPNPNVQIYFNSELNVVYLTSHDLKKDWGSAFLVMNRLTYEYAPVYSAVLASLPGAALGTTAYESSSAKLDLTQIHSTDIDSVHVKRVLVKRFDANKAVFHDARDEMGWDWSKEE